jgi:hypothetical protein
LSREARNLTSCHISAFSPAIAGIRVVRNPDKLAYIDRQLAVRS